MNVYTAGQWVLLFFFYCFCGWVWESCYVSARSRHWVNRGFLHGPLLPIYGSGAILILFVTLPVQTELWAVYLLGTLAATSLEYVTGAVMERIFAVRYWDYSGKRFNLHGYICLTSSVAWGFFSILLVKFLHPPAARILSAVPSALVDPLAFLLTVVFAVDSARSVQAALDLRELLERATAENEELQRLARRAEVFSAFAEEDLRRFREQTMLHRFLLEERVTVALEDHRQAVADRRRRRDKALEEVLRRENEARARALGAIRQALENARRSMMEEADRRVEELEQALRQEEQLERSGSTTPLQIYRQTMRLLRGNPTAAAEKYRAALEHLREIDKK